MPTQVVTARQCRGGNALTLHEQRAIRGHPRHHPRFDDRGIACVGQFRVLRQHCRQPGHHLQRALPVFGRARLQHGEQVNT
ncbi:MULTISPECIES: hypothetical protein [unclassified Xanthomonas]|uniref:hypothetical protein n=1 Tax=unclassified Xanthomonas TaxID=2643310 RepID=UPI001610027D|nr:MULTISPECIES: hypothetical protein [unclassified Xanthomonas]MBB4130856.1 hypothetical protein [Xanthomonas sp. 3075]MBB5864617.1 hypothetical protein [Xanthomonas sp. 3058]